MGFIFEIVYRAHALLPSASTIHSNFQNQFQIEFVFLNCCSLTARTLAGVAVFSTRGIHIGFGCFHLMIWVCCWFLLYHVLWDLMMLRHGFGGNNNCIRIWHLEVFSSKAFLVVMYLHGHKFSS
jgi:hypothetical protein